MSGWWNDGTNYDSYTCTTESYEDYSVLICQGSGFEDEYTITWISNDYTFSDGSTFWEITQNGESGVYNTYGYYENSNGEWFYGETDEESSYYEDSTGYWYTDIIGEVTHGEDNYMHFWKSARAGGEICYSKDDSYAGYIQNLFDDRNIVVGLWGWDSEGITWEMDGDGYVTVTDKAGNESYYDEDYDAFFITDPNTGDTLIWNEITHTLDVWLTGDGTDIDDESNDDSDDDSDVVDETSDDDE